MLALNLASINDKSLRSLKQINNILFLHYNYSFKMFKYNWLKVWFVIQPCINGCLAPTGLSLVTDSVCDLNGSQDADALREPSLGTSESLLRFLQMMSF